MKRRTWLVQIWLSSGARHATVTATSETRAAKLARRLMHRMGGRSALLCVADPHCFVDVTAGD